MVSLLDIGVCILHKFSGSRTHPTWERAHGNHCRFSGRKRAVVYLLWRLRWHLARRQMENNRKGILARDVALIFSLLATVAFSQSKQIGLWLSGQSGTQGVGAVYALLLLGYTALQATGLLSLSHRLPQEPLGSLPVSHTTLRGAEFWGLLLDMPLGLCLPFVFAIARWNGIGGVIGISLLLLAATALLVFLRPRRAATKPSLFARVRTESRLGMEGLLLLRHVQNHSPLRGPAALMITFFIAWIAPNIDKRFPLINLRDMLTITGASYFLLWQVQLLTNRFGAEYGTAGLLFLQPFPRKEMLVLRNIILVIFLLALDTVTTITITLFLGQTRWIVWILQAVIICLVTFTSFGNILSLYQPYTIRLAPGSLRREPENSVALLYVVIACLAGGLINITLQWPVLGWLATLAIYPLSVWIAAQIFPKKEAEMVATLEEK
jgi:hypothetical protein